ncbi:hypothetical protein DFH11DRAFT_292432 [Phellopilus nigrolimitatus]|nr:hypothetical protein DFH11DRAFT_292432 [Phellopilus nigrolimitatus]
MSQQHWYPDQLSLFPRSSAAFGFQQQDFTMSNNAPINRENTSDTFRDLYIPSCDLETTTLGYRDPQEFSCYSEGLRPSGNTRVLYSELQGPEQLPLAMPTPWRLETQASGLNEGISRSGPSMLISAVQPPYLSFGPAHCTESSFFLPPRPRGPVSTILVGGTIELSRSRMPGSGRPRHENFDLAGSAVTPFPRQANCLIYPAIRHEIDTTASENHLPLLSSPHYGTPFYYSGEDMPPNYGRECVVSPRMYTNAQFQAPGNRAYSLGISVLDPATTETPDLVGSYLCPSNDLLLIYIRTALGYRSTLPCITFMSDQRTLLPALLNRLLAQLYN